MDKHRQNRRQHFVELWERRRFLNPAFCFGLLLFVFSVTFEPLTTGSEELGEPQENIISPQTQKRRTYLMNFVAAETTKTSFHEWKECIVFLTTSYSNIKCGISFSWIFLAIYRSERCSWPKYFNKSWWGFVVGSSLNDKKKNRIQFPKLPISLFFSLWDFAFTEQNIILFFLFIKITSASITAQTSQECVWTRTASDQQITPLHGRNWLD